MNLLCVGVQSLQKTVLLAYFILVSCSDFDRDVLVIDVDIVVPYLYTDRVRYSRSMSSTPTD